MTSWIVSDICGNEEPLPEVKGLTSGEVKESTDQLVRFFSSVSSTVEECGSNNLSQLKDTLQEVPHPHPHSHTTSSLFSFSYLPIPIPSHPHSQSL